MMTKTNNMAVKPEWADQPLRVDPFALPQTVQRNDARRASYMVAASGTTVKTMVGGNLPLTMALPNRAFQGVAARAFENTDGSMTVTLELLHTDPALCVPLCVADTLEDAASDWHSWAKRLALPMLSIDHTGAVEVVKDAAGLVSRTPKPRRRRVSNIAHRPHFLRRRKPGMLGPVVRISGEELIARN
ncbi:DUF6101 family protein [Ahrensia sp. R2A130]|uniref:DUF6101 family protein n=1 Tax=Ahrensia sp. R2A130 TaxID=744979 RepID=UPI0001E0D102|nr:DUF6101 family protein [Ahrensia sp. R2A130]EFL88847.1 conserved hypothetical protein [Ahrensia sp. R2A130]